MKQCEAEGDLAGTSWIVFSLFSFFFFLLLQQTDFFSSSLLSSSSIQILPSMSLYDDIGEAPPYPEEKDADLLQKYNVPFDDSKLSSFFF